MSEDEFWDLSPAQFNALCERLELTTKEQNLRAGLMPSVFINAFKDKNNKKLVNPLDFFGGQKSQKDEEQAEIDAWAMGLKANMQAHNAKLKNKGTSNDK